MILLGVVVFFSFYRAALYARGVGDRKAVRLSVRQVREL